MSLFINLKKLQDDTLALSGEAPVTEVDLGFTDEVVRFTKPLKYSLTVQLLHDSLLLTGDLDLPVQCSCVRCLRPFEHVISFRDWACHIPMEGDEKPDMVRDSVDLTPYIREDMVLALPTHPVCRSDCPGLDFAAEGGISGGEKAAGEAPSPWDELNKLKLNS